jgi:two-component system, OmpR family, alkaline phosphatase synthesis response regulator PhoP
MPLIYYVEDDQAIRFIIEKTISNANLDGKGFPNGKLFLEAMQNKIPDFILLDMMLPDISGIELVKAVRKMSSDVPVMMLSALQDEMNKVSALDAGADDYMVKPFGVLELTSRIQSKLRKLRDYKILSLNNVTMDLRIHQITVEDKILTLTNKEYDILKLLLKSSHQVVTKELIFRDVWDTSYIGETRTLDMHIKSLRQKLASLHASVLIKTIRGVGYQIEPNT